MTASNKPKEHLILLPGWGFHSSIYSRFTTHLGDHFFQLTDLPKLHRANMSDVLCALPYFPPDSILIGWSLGGLIATTLCALFPRKFKRLILITSLPRFSAAPKYPGVLQTDFKQFHQSAKIDLTQLLTHFCANVAYPAKDRALRQHLASHLHSDSSWLFYLELLMQTDLRKECRALSLPVLHLFGKKDAVIPFEAAQSVMKANPNHTAFTINNAGHAIFLTHAKQLAKHIRTFIETSFNE